MRFAGVLKIWMIGFIGFIPLIGFSQYTTAEDTLSAPFRNHLAFGGGLLTRGWGLEVQYTLKANGYYHWFPLSLNYVKDYREFKRESLFKGQDGKSFILNKANYLLILGVAYGRMVDIIPIGKINKVNLKGGFAAGPSLALLVPYRIEKFVPDPNNPLLGTRQLTSFYEGVPYEQVISEAGFMSSTAEVKYKLAFTLRGQLELELGAEEAFIRAVTLGTRVDLFPNPIIVLIPYSRQVFYTGSIGFLMGNAW